MIKYLGAMYLLYLGVISIFNYYKNKSKILVENKNTKDSGVFKQGVIISVLNPKVAMFFLAFLPQFIDPLAINPTQELLTLGLLFSVLATSCNLLYASLGSLLFSSPKAKNYSGVLKGVSGTILVGLSAKIALSSNE